MTSQRRTRSLWAITAVMALVYIGIAAYMLDQVTATLRLIEHTYRTGTWAAIQIVQEYDRLQIAIYRAEAEPGAASAELLRERYDLLWSRLDVLGTGAETEGVRTIDGVPQTLEELKAALTALDRQLGIETAETFAAPTAAPEIIRTALAPFDTRLREIVRKSTIQDEYVYNRRDLGQATYQFGVLLAGLLLLGFAIIAVALTLAWRSTALVREARAARIEALRLNLAVSSSNDGIALTDAEGRFTQMNEAHVKMFGLRSEREAVGMHWSHLYDQAELERLHQVMEPALTRDRHWRGRSLGKTTDGTPVEQEISLTLLDDGGILCITRDMSAVLADQRSRRLLEEQLLVAQKMEAVGRLTSGFAHDFNNVLASVQGYGEMLRDDAAEGTTERRFASQILTATRRGRALVERILGFGRPSTDTADACDLGAAVEEAVGLLAGALPASIAVSSEGLTPGLTIGLSSDRLMQVLMNLGVNARDAIEGRPGRIRFLAGEAPASTWPSVSIGQRRPGIDYVCIRVEDNGDGIPADQMVRIFEPFFTTKGATTGTGLGLATVHSIVTGCGGQIVLASRPGEGTRFSLFLPRASLSGATAAGASTSREISPLRILIAEDDAMLCEAVAEALERHGYKVSTVHDGKAALDHLAQHGDEVDVLLTDEAMPVMRGSDVIRTLRRQGERLPIVLWSANADPVQLEAAGVIGSGAAAVEFCRKPASTDDLIAAIRRAAA